MSVNWSATSVAQETLEVAGKDANMIVVLQSNGWSVQIPKSLKCESEVWKVDGANTADSIRQNISKLMVKLIMRGGRREPIVQAAPPLKQPSSNELSKAMVRVFLESKGRGGKKVSVVTGIPLDDVAMEEMTTKLKRVCGTGGTYKDGQIEIQGDHRDKLLSELQKLGYKPKRAGG